MLHRVSPSPSLFDSLIQDSGRTSHFQDYYFRASPSYFCRRLSPTCILVLLQRYHLPASLLRNKTFHLQYRNLQAFAVNLKASLLVLGQFLWAEAEQHRNSFVRIEFRAAKTYRTLATQSTKRDIYARPNRRKRTNQLELAHKCLCLVR